VSSLFLSFVGYRSVDLQDFLRFSLGSPLRFCLRRRFDFWPMIKTRVGAIREIRPCDENLNEETCLEDEKGCSLNISVKILTYVTNRFDYYGDFQMTTIFFFFIETHVRRNLWLASCEVSFRLGDKKIVKRGTCFDVSDL